MTENKTENLKREVPVFSFDEYLEALKKGKSLTLGGTGCYKIQEEDKERFLEYIEKNM